VLFPALTFVLSAGLHLVHGAIRHTDQVINVFEVIGINGDADASTDITDGSTDVDRLIDGPDDFSATRDASSTFFR
jgi:hypothetical protein